jgi:hypothetical protein
LGLTLKHITKIGKLRTKKVFYIIPGHNVIRLFFFVADAPVAFTIKHYFCTFGFKSMFVERWVSSSALLTLLVR